MAHRPTPPSRDQIQDQGRLNWHTMFRPHFDELVALGYIEGAGIFSYGATIEGYKKVDGVVAFREGTPLPYGPDLAADTVYLVSSSISDTGTYRIIGLDENGDLQDETVTATGTTPVAVIGSWNHVQRIIHSSDLSDNVGTVYVSTKSGAGVPILASDQIQVVIPPADNYAINPLIVVPNKWTLLIHAFDFTTDTSQGNTIEIFANRQGNWILNFKFFVSRDDAFNQSFHAPLALFEGDKMRVQIEAEGATEAKSGFGFNTIYVTDNRDPTLKTSGTGQLYGGA